ncbi:MAG TPA: NAD(+)/NADH kinase [Sphingobacteriaceae bacterium]|nr:NAD(+)/NADH kinase [Sphingobacteriaceae bacterium]
MPAVYLHTRDDNPKALRVRDRCAEVLVAAGHTLAERPVEAEIIASIGGDGTLLSAIARFHYLEIPFLGINAGNLGFLQEADEEDLPLVAQMLATGNYQVQSIPLLAAWRESGELVSYAFNEVVVERAGTRTLKIVMSVDGVEVGTMVGDGAIVSSPSGSTAYALAAGGAMMAPTVSALQLVTINPHKSKLASPMPTPIILPADSLVQLQQAPERPRPARLVLDGRPYEMNVGECINIGRSDRTVRIIRLGIHTFWEHVRLKFSTFEPRTK